MSYCKIHHLIKNIKIIAMKNYESPDDALNDLRARGYEADFEPSQIACTAVDLICGYTKKNFI